MVKACFTKPKTEDDGREFSMNDIVEAIAMRYPHVQCNMGLKMRVGGTLKKMGYQVRHHKTGNFYLLVPKKVA